jgi:hypothetical protein
LDGQEERRATLPQYRPHAASLGGMMVASAGMVCSSPAAASEAAAPAPAAHYLASSMAAAAAAAANAAMEVSAGMCCESVFHFSNKPYSPYRLKR